MTRAMVAISIGRRRNVLCASMWATRADSDGIFTPDVIHFFVVTDRFLAGGGCRPRSVGRGVFLSSPDTPHPFSVCVVYMCVNLQIDSGNINTKASRQASATHTHPKMNVESIYVDPYMHLSLHDLGGDLRGCEEPSARVPLSPDLHTLGVLDAHLFALEGREPGVVRTLRSGRRPLDVRERLWVVRSLVHAHGVAGERAVRGTGLGDEQRAGMIRLGPLLARRGHLGGARGGGAILRMSGWGCFTFISSP